MDGWIKLHRKSLESSVFQDPELWKLWILCLLKASHKECFMSWEGIREPVELKPGQFITGRFALHKDFYPRKKKNQKSPLTLWKWLQILEKLENINIKSNNKYSIITIVNWETYQSNKNHKEQQIEQQTNNRLTTEEQQTNTYNNNKNDKNDKKEDVYDHLFDLFWKNYPKKVGKKAAFKAWKKIKNKTEVIEKMKIVLLKQMESEQWNKNNGQYIPNPSTYLNQGRWEDEVQ